MDLKPGSRWRSAVCTAEAIVIRPPNTDINLECGGHEMLAAGSAPAEGLSIASEHATGVTVGKRYVDVDSGLEVLAAKAGQGSLSANGRELTLKDAKPLPASD